MGMDKTVQSTISPLIKKYENFEVEIKTFQFEKNLVVYVSKEILKIIKSNPSEFYNLTEKFNVENLSYVRFDENKKSKKCDLKVSKLYLKELAMDIVFPKLVDGFYTE